MSLTPRPFSHRQAPRPADHSIGCEKCHGPGGNHLLAVAARFPDLAIARPSLASGARVVKICAQCHSPRAKAVEPDDPTSVRFQGTTLTWSRCYTESKERLDCVTCHDPHRNVVTESRTTRQSAWHATPGASRRTRPGPGTHCGGFDLAEAPRAPTCPVNPAAGLHLLSHAQGQQCRLALLLHRPFHPGPPRKFHGE